MKPRNSAELAEARFDGKVGSAVELKDVWYAYNRSCYALKGIDLTVKRGSSTVVLGPSGSGKTTLLKIINGLLKPSKGTVEFHLDGLSPKELRQKIGYIPQQLGLVLNLTVMENTLIGALPRVGKVSSLLGIFPEEEVDFAEGCLKLVGIEHKAYDKCFRLSGGERQRVAIARALMQKPLILAADEFISELDYVRAHEIMDLVQAIRKKGVTLVMAMHDIDIAAHYGETAVIIKGGVKVSEEEACELRPENVRRFFS